MSSVEDRLKRLEEQLSASSSSSNNKPNVTTTSAWDKGFQCDGAEHNIYKVTQGPRFHCVECFDFDLCWDCYQKDTEHEHHAFLCYKYGINKKPPSPPVFPASSWPDHTRIQPGLPPGRSQPSPPTYATPMSGIGRGVYVGQSSQGVRPPAVGVGVGAGPRVGGNVYAHQASTASVVSIKRDAETGNLHIEKVPEEPPQKRQHTSEEEVALTPF